MLPLSGPKQEANMTHTFFINKLIEGTLSNMQQSPISSLISSHLQFHQMDFHSSSTATTWATNEQLFILHQM